MDDKQLKAISETAYLSAKNVRRYRGILHYFYLQYEKMCQYREEQLDTEELVGASLVTLIPYLWDEKSRVLAVTEDG